MSKKKPQNKRHHNKQPSFTLIESIIALLLLCIIGSFFIKLTHSFRAMILQSAVHQFILTCATAHHQAHISQQPQRISFDAQQRSYRLHNDHSILLPAGVSVIIPHKDILFYAHGSSTPQSIVFQAPPHHTTARLTCNEINPYHLF